MELGTYIDDLRRHLAVAAEAGGEDARALAERLTAPLESATRLMLLDALSAAAAEITRELAPGSVELRLRGLDPDFAVTSGAAFAAGSDGTDGPGGAEAAASAASAGPAGPAATAGTSGLAGSGGGIRPAGVTGSGPDPSSGSSVPDGATMASDGATAFAAPEAEDGAAARINLRVPPRLKHRIEEAAARDSLSVNAWLVRALSVAVEADRGGRRSSGSATHGGQRLTGWVR